MSKFGKFTMFLKRQKFGETMYDVTLTSAYMSFSNKAMKQLGTTLGDKVAVAVVEEDDGTVVVLIAASISDKSYPLVTKSKVKANAPLLFVSVGKKMPETKGSFYLKRYGSHENHEWWALTSEKPKKLTMF